MSLIYAAALLISLFGMVMIDRRFKLAFWQSPARSAAVVATGVVGFLLWDLSGIGLGIFFRGPGPWQSGLVIAPELPVEEVLFLTLLSYITLLTYLFVQRRRESRRA